jgi:hypothetical protein
MTSRLLRADYFENCNSDVVCPCVFSTHPQLTTQPSYGVCDVILGFHIEQGRFDQTSLDELNVAVVAHTWPHGQWQLDGGLCRPRSAYPAVRRVRWAKAALHLTLRRRSGWVRNTRTQQTQGERCSRSLWNARGKRERADSGRLECEHFPLEVQG